MGDASLAEESGIIVIRGPEDLLKKFVGAEGSETSGLLLNLAEVTGFDKKFLERESYLFDSSVLHSGYLKIEYDGPEWSYISASVVRTGKNIELYSRASNEYGVHRYFALTKKGKKFVYSIDLESDQLDSKEGAEEALHQLMEWLARIPEEVNQYFPSLSDIEVDSIVPPKSYVPERLAINMECKLDLSVTEQTIREAIDGKFGDFTLTTYKNSEHAGGSYCGFWDKIRIKTMDLKPQHFESYKRASWVPISRDEKTAKELLELLISAGIYPKFAIEYFGDQSAPYIIHHFDGEEIQTLFDSSDFTDQELEILTRDSGELDMKVNWFSFAFEQIRYLHENFGIKKYARDRLAYLANK